MYGRDGVRDVAGLLDVLAEDAERREVPRDVIEEARAAVTRTFGSDDGPEKSRVVAYFWGVVRRRALRGGVPALRRRLLATSLAEELVAAGHPLSSVREEIRRAYGCAADAVPFDATRAGQPARVA